MNILKHLSFWSVAALSFLAVERAEAQAERPVVTLHVLVAETSEPAENIRIQPGRLVVRRSGSTAERLMVRYSVGGTAINGRDYQRLIGRVIIPAGASEAEIIVGPLEDNRVEGDETVIIRLEPRERYEIGSPRAGRVVIHDTTQRPVR